MKHSKQDGHTLAEALIAIVLGILVITAIASTLDAGIFTAKDSRARMYATNALRNELEALRRMDFDAMLAAGNTSFSNEMIDKLQNGSGTRTIGDSLGADIKRVTLTVSWTGSRGDTLSETLTTDITRRGLNGR